MISLAFTIARGGSCSAFHYLMNPTFHNKCKCPWAGQEKHVPKLLPTTFSKSHLALPRAKGENSMLGSMPLAASFLSEVKSISFQLHISGHQRFNVERSKLYQAISHPSRNMSPMPLQRLSDCPPHYSPIFFACEGLRIHNCSPSPAWQESGQGFHISIQINKGVFLLPKALWKPTLRGRLLQK